jgi:hypothetical protein
MCLGGDQESQALYLPFLFSIENVDAAFASIGVERCQRILRVGADRHCSKTQLRSAA